MARESQYNYGVQSYCSRVHEVRKDSRTYLCCGKKYHPCILPNQTSHLCTSLSILAPIPIPKPPSPQGQRLQLQRGGPDIYHKCNHPNYHANDISNVVSISRDIACTAPIDTTVLLCFGDAVERGCNEGAFEIFFWGRRCGWVANCDSEIVDKFKDEEARECTAKV